MNGVLLPQHLADLRRSGLSDETIAAAGLYSIDDPQEAARILSWGRPAEWLEACLVYPFPDVQGRMSGFARLKPDQPRAERGKAVKYEQPRGAPPRAYFPPGVIAAIAEPGQTIGIVEGEKKALAAYQAGFPCIGLTGVFAWTSGRDDDGKGERLLIPDLAAIDWNRRIVWICFDTDENRNPNVNHARAELARILSALGAVVAFVELPLGCRGSNGLPIKMGADDFIVAYGELAFRELVEGAMRGEGPARLLEDYRRDLEDARLRSVDVPGIYLDTSPPGAGKSFADVPAMNRAGSSLTVLATHKACEEVVQVLCSLDTLATAYPKLSAENCQNFTEANAALDVGLSASAAVCPTCLHHNACNYRDQMGEAEAAAHAVATHRRAALSLGNPARP